MSRRPASPRIHRRAFAQGALGIPVLVVIACQPRQARVVEPPAAITPTPTAAPVPVRLPDDDAPHDTLTEWWYYTGHLYDAEGREYGFEFVIFQSIRGDNPIGYLSHFAITDSVRGRFRYSYRVGQRQRIPGALDLEVGGWTLQGGAGNDRLTATTVEYALELTTTPRKPAALHHGGLISFGAAGDSYYYSRTRLGVSGRLRDGARWRQVEGQAWFDHQWGNFVVAPVGGWDWFSVQLDGDRELMISLLRDAQGGSAGAFGTFVDPAGQAIEVPPELITVEPHARWVSPHTGASYPSGWQVRMAGRSDLNLPVLNLRLDPLVVDQELAFERMAYWEGAVRVAGSIDGSAVTGEGYVELTGYLPD